MDKDPSIYRILDYWAKHVEFDPEQNRFNLLSSNYEFHRCGKTMKKIIENYDPSGKLAVMYAKLRYKEILSQCKATLFSLIEHPEELDPYIKMWSMFNSSEIDSAENAIIDEFNRKLSLIEGCKLIGEESKEDSLSRIYDSIGDVCEVLDQCRIEAYCKSTDPSIHLSSLCSYVCIYDTLAECLLSIEKSRDMVYLCYIREYQSSAGYFAFIFKKGDNIISVNDRVDESYIGQHQNSRNGSWQESKQFNLFPYSKIIEETRGSDYKGYPVEYVVSKSNFPIRDLGPEWYIRIVLALVLLNNKFSTLDISQLPLVYTNSLMVNSVLLTSGDENSTDMIDVSNSLVAEHHSDIHIHFSDDDIVSGRLSSKFNQSKESKKRIGNYTNRNQDLVDLYGAGFHVDESSFVRYARYIELPSESKYLGNTNRVVSEYIGTEYDMEAQAYRDARNQLACYIKNQMKAELESFGGRDAVISWYSNLISQKKDILIRKAVKFYKEIIIDKCRSNYDYSPFSMSCSKNIQVSVRFETQPSYGYTVMLNDDAIKDSYGSYKYLCPITGNAANVWIWISPQTSENIKDLFEEATLPKIIEGWVLNDSINGYNGNSILENVDPVGEMKHILTYHNSPGYTDDCRFYLCIGLSKRGINKILSMLS